MYFIKRKNHGIPRQKVMMTDINEVAKERFFFMSHGINGIR